MNPALPEPNREFLKIFLTLVAGALFAAAILFAIVSGARADDESEPDFAGVNPAMQAISDVLTATDPLVNVAYPTFDPKASNLKQGTLKYDAFGSAKNVPWLPGSTAQLTATTIWKADFDSYYTGIGVDLTASITTDMFALFRYAGVLALKKRQSAPKFDARIEANLQALSVVRSLEDLRDILVSGQKLSHDIYADYIAADNAHVQCLLSGPCQSDSERDAELRSERDEIHDLEIVSDANDTTSIVPVVQGEKITALKLTTSNLNGFFFSGGDERPRPGKTEFDFSAQGGVATATVFVRRNLDKLNHLRSDLRVRVQGLAAGDTSAKDRMTADFRRALIAFKKVVNGEAF